MSRYDVLRLLHIVAAMVWVGGVLVMRIVGNRLKTADPAHRLGFTRDQAALIRGLFTPAAAAILATGMWMVVDAPGFAFDQAWIAIGLVVVIGSMGLAHGYTLPRIGRAVALMESGRGPEAGTIMTRLTPVIRTVIVLLVVTVWAMVVKPGL